MSDPNQTMKKPMSKWILAGAAVLTIGAGVAVADWARGGYGAGQGGYGWHGRGMHGAQGQARMERFCERDPLRFEGVARAFIKADLDLTSAQNAELDKLAAGIVPALKDLRDEVCNNFSERNASAPDRFERMAKILRKAADAAEKNAAPVRNFYAALDEKQKQRVDEVANRRHRGGPMMQDGGPGQPRR